MVLLAGGFRYGYEAVLCFFVLSGLVIHRRLANARRRGQATFDFGYYARHRAGRIYVPLLAALLVTLALDGLGRTLNPAYYADPTHFFGLGARGADWSPVTFAGNLLFLQNILVPVFGTNGPLWSLGVEGLIYIFYPLVFVPLYLRVGPRWAFGLCGSVAGLGSLLWYATGQQGFSILAFMGVWLGGAFLAELVTGQISLRHADAVLGVALGFLAVLAALYGVIPGGLKEILWAGGILAAIAVLAMPGKGRLRGLAIKALSTLRPLSPFSYTLYLLHFPTLVLCSALYMKWQGGLVAAPWLALLAVALCLGMAALTGPVIERQYLK